MYINIIDSQGATDGYGGPYLPITHRVLYEKGTFHGYDSIRKRFTSSQEVSMFLMMTIGLKTGTYGNFSWSQE